MSVIALPASSTGLKRRAMRGAAATIAGQLSNLSIMTASTAVLARLLRPEDYGLLAMVATFTTFAGLFPNAGLSDAIIQRREVGDQELSKLFWINLAISASVAACVVALAPAVAWFYNEPALVPITVALALTFVPGGAAVQHQALLARSMRFTALAAAGTGALVLSSALGIGLAVAHFGYWSLVWMKVSQSLFYAAALWSISGWKPGRARAAVRVGGMVRFGAHLTGFNVVNYFARNLDNVLVGKICGAFALGLYSRAYTLFMLPLLQLRNPVSSVAMPALSRLQNDPPRYRQFYLRMVAYLAFLTMPAVVFCFIHSGPIVAVFLGPRWSEASRIFAVFTLVGFLQPVESTKNVVMVSLGRTRRNLNWAAMDAAAISAAFVVGVQWGALGVAWAYVVANGLLLFPGLRYAFHGSPVTPADFFRTVLNPSIASLGMGVVLYVLPHPAAGGLPLLVWSGLRAGLLYTAVWLVLPGGLRFLKQLRADLRQVGPTRDDS